MPYFDEPVGRVKIQTTSKNSQRYYTTKRLIRYLLSNTPNGCVRAGEFRGYLFTGDTALHCIDCIVSYRIVSYRVVSCRVVSCRVVLRCIALRCVALRCVVLAGSFAVHIGDHLRFNLGIISGLGIICGRGSFAALNRSLVDPTCAAFYRMRSIALYVTHLRFFGP